MGRSAAAPGGLSSRAELPLLCLGDMASERNVHCNLMLLLHPSALPSFPPCRSPLSLFFHARSYSAPLGPTLPPACFSFTRTRHGSQKKKIQWRLLERAFEEVVFASQMPRPDASVRIMFLYILTCMHFSTKQKEQTHRPSAEESRGIKKQASDIKLTRFNT